VFGLFVAAQAGNVTTHEAKRAMSFEFTPSFFADASAAGNPDFELVRDAESLMALGAEQSAG
jgi:hypothetical protein